MKLQAYKDHKDWSLNDNAVASLKRIKELSHSTTEVQCKCWTMTDDMCKTMTIEQNNGEPMSKFCKRFKNVINTIEGQWGESFPVKAPEWKNKSVNGVHVAQMKIEFQILMCDTSHTQI